MALLKQVGIERVDMSDQLISVLRTLYTRRQKEALSEGRGEVHEVVFHRNGKPFEQNYNRRIYKRILNRAGLREMRFHDIRHTFASLLLTDGASPECMLKSNLVIPAYK